MSESGPADTDPSPATSVGGQAMVGRVIGTDDATPLEFWVAVAPDQFLQLDDVVALERTPPGRDPVRIYGIVNQVRARHEGARFDSDVFLISDGVLPAEVSEAAQVLSTRFEPEVFIPPLPGQPVRRATGDDRDEALFFDGMAKRLPAGLSREDEPVYVNLEFLDGTRGAHVNISGVSGVATKTTYATFLLHSLFTSGVLTHSANAKALVFNVKGEDLLFLDHTNKTLDESQTARYHALGLEASAFRSVDFWAPPKRGASTAAADTGARIEGVTSFFWTLEEFCREELLPFLFTDAQDDRQQYTMVVHQVAAMLKRHAAPVGDGAVSLEGVTCRPFGDLLGPWSRTTRRATCGPAAPSASAPSTPSSGDCSAPNATSNTSSAGTCPNRTAIASATRPRSPSSTSTTSTTAPSGSSSGWCCGARSRTRNGQARRTR